MFKIQGTVISLFMDNVDSYFQAIDIVIMGIMLFNGLYYPGR